MAAGMHHGAAVIEEFDAIVIGSGEAGAEIASLAVANGKKTAMLYVPPYGSTCINVGCVPSKFLIHRANLAHAIRTAGRFGIRAGDPVVDLPAIVAEKKKLVTEHRARSHEAARKAEGLTAIEGRARFRSAREVAVGERVLRAPRTFIATGMRPLVPKIDGLDRVHAYTNDDVMDLEAVPPRLIVIGGGYVACELGQAYSRLGSNVTIVQSRDRLLPNEEPDVSRVLGEAFASEGIAVLLEHRAESVDGSDGALQISARSAAGATRVVEGTHLLVAAGRRPNTDGLALDAAGIETDEKGSLKVDEYLETSAAGVYAAGDVVGAQPFTRVAQEEAKVAYANAFGSERVAVDRAAYGHAIFTDPEIGSVGLTEHGAREAGHQVKVGYVTFDAIAKAEITGATTGFIKYVIESASHRLLGAHVIGAQAADLVYDAIVVMRHRGRLEELADAIGIFPTLQEGMEGSARALLARVAS